ncbi:hypothetical protein JCM19301_3051 [Jejuia pallidilutea]|uniref:Uncharacterized protein n=1 Tax=Jejuia pallidilutea TaxID=504487 RepID=A0A090VRG1_9FLAO|nr:hypothetical protein JCM19301_3051 [Jejuia pallidilutea]
MLTIQDGGGPITQGIGPTHGAKAVAAATFSAIATVVSQP